MADEDDDSCERSPDGKHHPNWHSISVEVDGDTTYVDVHCMHCGKSGCVGSAEVLEQGISW